VELGEELGRGGFSNVFAVDSFKHIGKRNRGIKRAHREARDHVIRTAVDSQYAVKFLKKELTKDPRGFDVAAQHLKLEADMLSCLDHPHIIKIRGWAANGFNAYYKMRRYDAYFLILDRIETTLSKKIEEWKVLMDSVECINGCMESGQAGAKLMAERLQLALDIASALEYIHEMEYIFRDLKPSNIGLDSRGRGKLFDFGLAKQLPHGATDEEFRMTGEVGSTRYMAPEVNQNKPYNSKADVYSFSLVLWEMLALEKPFADYTQSMHKKSIVENGKRPDMDPSWPLGIQKLLAKSWHPNIAQRPTMKEICNILRMEMAELKSGNA